MLASYGGVTLLHQNADVAPVCSVVFGANAIDDLGEAYMRRVEISFDNACYVRVQPHLDSEGAEDVGFEVIDKLVEPEPIEAWLEWRKNEWRETGYCPYPNFYVATQSDWINGLKLWPDYNPFHYVVMGRDCHVEILAESYEWHEWVWEGGHRDTITDKGQSIRRGKGTE